MWYVVFYAQWDSFQTEIQRVKSGGAAADDKKFIEVHNTAPVKVVVNVLLPTKEHPKVCIGKYLGYNTGNPVQLCVELIRKKLVNYHCYTLKHAVSYSMLRGYSFTFFRLISLNVYKKEHTFNWFYKYHYQGCEPHYKIKYHRFHNIVLWFKELKNNNLKLKCHEFWSWASDKETIKLPVVIVTRIR